MSAKKNQPGLLAAITRLFDAAPVPWSEPRTATTTNKAHGRIEVRHLRASTELADSLADQWRDLARVFQIERHVTRAGKLTHAVTSGLTSLPARDGGPDQLRAVVRAHGHLENRVHWRRDVTLREDSSRLRTGHAPQLLAALNNVVLTFMDHRGVANVPGKMREFNARPAIALALLLRAHCLLRCPEDHTVHLEKCAGPNPFVMRASRPPARLAPGVGTPGPCKLLASFAIDTSPARGRTALGGNHSF
ncbi:MAG: ISAs1 family transposase [Ardenticatenaceae bacterium]|nr:ISAs1 family transposase [Ardenticatenaceae bacterium]